MLAAARQFSEDDLTRDLKLALDLFRDLQSSLQPRLHLEMGLLRLIHAGRLQPIEEAIAALGRWIAPENRRQNIASRTQSPHRAIRASVARTLHGNRRQSPRLRG